MKKLLPTNQAEWFLTAILLVGIFATPLYKFRIEPFGIYLLPMDLVFIALLGWLLVQKLGSRSARISLRYTGPVAILLACIGLATLVGLARTHEWQSVLRETKLGVYFLLVPYFAHQIANGRIQLKRIYWIILIATTLGSLYDLYARIFDIYPFSALSGWVEGAVAYAYTPFGRIIRDYGWVSTFHYQVFAFLIAVSLLIHSQAQRWRWAILGMAAINLIANMLTVTRGFMFGIVVGALTLLILLTTCITSRGEIFLLGKPTRNMVRWGLLAAGLLAVIIPFFPQITASFLRLLSIIDPDLAGAGDIANMNLRINSIALGFETALQNLLGKGYGLTTSLQSASAADIQVMYMLFHNSLGYMFYYFGLFGGLLVFGMLLFLGARGAIASLAAQGARKLELTILVSGYVAMNGMAFTSGNFLFTVDNVLPFFIFSLSGLSTIRLTHPPAEPSDA